MKNPSKISNLKFLFFSLILLICSQAVLAGIFTLSQQQEIVLGAQAATQVERTQQVLNDTETTKYVTEVGQRLVSRSQRSDIPYRFRVINSKEVNAFALPGGFVYINRGLIEQADTENEFIGVLAHEVSHIVARHSAEQVEKSRKANLILGGAGLLLGGARNGRALFNGAQLLTQGVFLKFSRDAEREADRLGAKTMFDAGWNPQGMVSFFQKLAQRGGSNVAFFSTHPSPQERYNNIADLTKAWGNKRSIDSKQFQAINTRIASFPKPRNSNNRQQMR